MYPVLLDLGVYQLRAYGVFAALAILTSIWYAGREARRKDLDPALVTDAAWPIVLAGLAGARLYYVAFNWDYYSRALPKIIAVWEGGLAIHGGLLGGLLLGGGYAWWKRLPLPRYLDIVAPSLALGQGIGRWGNFFNEEAFGTPTSLPWKLYISPPHRPLLYAQEEFFHPTFLYEALWDFLVFALLLWVLRDRVARAPTCLFWMYLGLYSVGRLIVEGFRTDSLMLGSIRVAQLASGIGIVLAIVLVPILLKRSRPA